MGGLVAVCTVGELSVTTRGLRFLHQKQVNRARDITGGVCVMCVLRLQCADGGVVWPPQRLKKIVSTAKHLCEAKGPVLLRLSRW